MTQRVVPAQVVRQGDAVEERPLGIALNLRGEGEDVGQARAGTAHDDENAETRGTPVLERVVQAQLTLPAIDVPRRGQALGAVVELDHEPQVRPAGREKLEGTIGLEHAAGHRQTEGVLPVVAAEAYAGHARGNQRVHNELREAVSMVLVPNGDRAKGPFGRKRSIRTFEQAMPV